MTRLRSLLATVTDLVLLPQHGPTRRLVVEGDTATRLLAWLDGRTLTDAIDILETHDPRRPHNPQPATDAECVAGLNALYPDAHPGDDWSDTELRTMAAVIRAVDRARTGDQQ